MMFSVRGPSSLSARVAPGKGSPTFHGAVTVARRSGTRLQARRSTKTVSPHNDDDGELDSKRKADMLDKVMADINTQFGKGSIMKLGSAPTSIDCNSTGCLPLDVALGGGYPKGRVIEIFGPESSGKTTLALHAIAEVQKKGGIAVFIDAEHAFDPDYAKNVGVDTAQLYLNQPDSGESALEIMDRLARSSLVNLIVVDSVAALVPRAELEGEVGQLQVGSQARLMSQGLRKLCGSARKSGCTLMFLNQIRMKVGVIYGSPETTSGGQALKFYSSVRIDVRSKEKIMGDNSTQVGIKVKAKAVKNKVAPPFKEAYFDIMFGSGIDSIGCLVDSADTLKVLNRRGSWYYLGEDKLCQGRDALVRLLGEKEDLRRQIEDMTREMLKSQAQSAPGASSDDTDLDLPDAMPEEDL